MPGELESLTREKQLKEGIVYPVEIIEEINAIASSCGIEKCRCAFAKILFLPVCLGTVF